MTEDGRHVSTLGDRVPGAAPGNLGVSLCGKDCLCFHRRPSQLKSQLSPPGEEKDSLLC